ncbi:MAG: c-type cytochrome, partial [Myxococcales bacterium]
AGALLLPLVFATGERSPQRRPIAVALVLLSGVLLGWLLVLGMRAPWVPKVNTEPLTAAQVGHAEGPVWRGSQLYFEKGCQYCHLALGRGGRYGPDLTDVLLRLSPEATATRIVAGIGDMPAYRSALTDRELEDLMSFLRAMAERHSGMAGPAEPDQGGQR